MSVILAPLMLLPVKQAGSFSAASLVNNGGEVKPSESWIALLAS